MGETTKTMWKVAGKSNGKESWQMIAPATLRLKITELAHTGMTGGQLGHVRTKEQVRRRAYWPGWSKFVEAYCQACQPCVRFKRGKPLRQGLMQPIAVGSTWEVLSLDITGSHPKSSSGNVYILTIIDQFSKFALAFPIRNQEAVTIAKILVDQVFAYFGVPLRILTDQGRNFESELFLELCRSMGIDKVRTSSYRATTNGLLERFHRTLNSMIAKVVKESQRDWDLHMPQIMAAYRASINSVTGYSPNYLIFGKENRAPIDLVMRNPEVCQ